MVIPTRALPTEHEPAIGGSDDVRYESCIPPPLMKMASDESGCRGNERAAISGTIVRRGGFPTLDAVGEDAARAVARDGYARRVLAGATPRYFRKRMAGGKRFLIAVVGGGVFWGLWMGVFFDFAPTFIATIAFYALWVGFYFLTMTPMRLIVSDRAIHRQQGCLREIPLDRVETMCVEPARFHWNWVGWFEKGTGHSVVVRYRARSGRSREARFDVDDPERFIAAVRPPPPAE